MTIDDEVADYVDAYEARREQERIDRQLEVFTDAFRSAGCALREDSPTPPTSPERVTLSKGDPRDADGFEAGEPWYLDMATGEWSQTPAPLASGPTGTVTRITSGEITFDAGPAVVPSREPGNRRARRAARARARQRLRGRGVLGTIVAVEGGSLHVRMPDGTVERVELGADDVEDSYVVGGLVTIGGV